MEGILSTGPGTTSAQLELNLQPTTNQLNVSELLKEMECILTTRNHTAMQGQTCFLEAVLYTEA